eukprot:symbB.v1.2.025680.t1/scaffold2496.1/size77716/6
MFRPLRHAFHRGFRAMSGKTTSRGSWYRTSFITAAGTVGAGAVVGMVWSPINCDTTSKKEGQVLLKDGRKIFYQSTGQGIPVFAFHGMGSAHSTWTSEHSEPGIRLIAIDRPGYGLSCPPPAGYSYTQFVSDLEQLANSLGLEHFCVMGHSSGGPYALAAAALLPKRVLACAAVCSDPPYSHPKTPEAVRLADECIHPVFGVVDKRLHQLGLKLQKPVAPVANYVAWRKSGDVIYISGQIPKEGDLLHTGQVGSTMGVEDAVKAAKLCGLNLVAQMREACDGNLDRVKKVLQVQGFVASTADFTGHPQVINGVSDLLVDIFGKEVGAHSRFAVGCSSLPLGVPVEVGAVIEIDNSATASRTSGLGFYGVDPIFKCQLMANEQMEEKRKYAWQQGPLGFVTDFTLERLPWSFALEDIVLKDRLTIWYGEKDFPAILLGAPFLQSLIPGSKLRMVPDGDHGFKRYPEHLSAILQELKTQFNKS